MFTEVQASYVGLCHRNHGRTRNLKTPAVHDRPLRPETSTAPSQKEAYPNDPNAETRKSHIFQLARALRRLALCGRGSRPPSVAQRAQKASPPKPLKRLLSLRSVLEWLGARWYQLSTGRSAFCVP